MAAETKYKIGRKEYTIDELNELFYKINNKLDQELSIEDTGKICNEYIKLMKALLEKDLVLTQELIEFRDKLAGIADKVSKSLNKTFSGMSSKQ